jgi:hypothetical protein
VIRSRSRALGAAHAATRHRGPRYLCRAAAGFFLFSFCREARTRSIAAALHSSHVRRPLRAFRVAQTTQAFEGAFARLRAIRSADVLTVTVYQPSATASASVSNPSATSQAEGARTAPL